MKLEVTKEIEEEEEEEDGQKGELSISMYISF